VPETGVPHVSPLLRDMGAATTPHQNKANREQTQARNPRDLGHAAAYSLFPSAFPE